MNGYITIALEMYSSAVFDRMLAGMFRPYVVDEMIRKRQLGAPYQINSIVSMRIGQIRVGDKYIIRPKEMRWLEVV